MSVWGHRADGSKFVVGLTVRALVDALRAAVEVPDGDGALWSWEDEVCLVVDPYAGLPGKALRVERGTRGQLWIIAFVVDESIAEGREPPARRAT